MAERRTSYLDRFKNKRTTRLVGQVSGVRADTRPSWDRPMTFMDALQAQYSDAKPLFAPAQQFPQKSPESVTWDKIKGSKRFS
jgi:hypothetical protein